MAGSCQNQSTGERAARLLCYLTGFHQHLRIPAEWELGDHRLEYTAVRLGGHCVSIKASRRCAAQWIALCSLQRKRGESGHVCSGPRLNPPFLSLNGWIYYPRDEQSTGHNQWLWKTCKTGGFIGFLEMNVRQMRKEAAPTHGPARRRDEGPRAVVLHHGLSQQYLCSLTDFHVLLYKSQTMLLLHPKRINQKMSF